MLNVTQESLSRDMHDIILFALKTGMRTGEIDGMRHFQVNRYKISWGFQTGFGRGSGALGPSCRAGHVGQPLSGR